MSFDVGAKRLDNLHALEGVSTAFVSHPIGLHLPQHELDLGLITRLVGQACDLRKASLNGRDAIRGGGNGRLQF